MEDRLRWPRDDRAPEGDERGEGIRDDGARDFRRESRRVPEALQPARFDLGAVEIHRAVRSMEARVAMEGAPDRIPARAAAMNARAAQPVRIGPWVGAV